ncbi:MAG: transaldolase [Anaerolineae bacterium]|nr:transaldolase [Anaerolineae bacterium]
MTNKTKLYELARLGQSIWLDYIRRDLMTSGELDERIAQGLSGMTSNPSIFEKAIASGLYDQFLDSLSIAGNQPELIYEMLAVHDIQSAADHFRGVYDATDGADGYVSLEANPYLANDREGTVEEIKKLHRLVNRPNVMFKVPATDAGVEAVADLIGDGININITLMFSLSHYNAVAQAYLRGLERLREHGGDLPTVASVASFFVSRVDVILEPMLEEAGAPELKGKIGIANAKQVYKRFDEMFSGLRWQSLASSGARVQRPLWASTSTKSPDEPDTMYVDSLIGPHTVNTLPPATLNAFLDHGTVARTLDRNLDEADAQLAKLVAHDINLLEVGETLQRQGVAKFQEAFDSLLFAIIRRTEQPTR